MDDKLLMEGLLWDMKVLSDLSFHGSIEASTSGIKQEFKSALKNVLSMQEDIYNKMSDAGYYPAEQVEQSKIAETKSKFDETIEYKEE